MIFDVTTLTLTAVVVARERAGNDARAHALAAAAHVSSAVAHIDDHNLVEAAKALTDWSAHLAAARQAESLMHAADAELTVFASSQNGEDVAGEG